MDDAPPAPVEDRSATLYRFGTRVSGMTFSPGGNVSMVLYDKVLHGRLRGKRHMEPLWQAAGWQPGVPVTRHEARLRRPAVRELGFVGETSSCLDDPWDCLTHLAAIFVAVVGHAEECPDTLDAAWVRRVVPEAGDANRSRWPTDPVWQVVQSATFAEAPADARRLIRRRQRGADVGVLDRGQYGYLISRTALLHPNGGQWTLSRALGETARALAIYEERVGKDFGALVRERRRQRGLPVPVAEQVLPFHPWSRPDPAAVAEESGVGVVDMRVVSTGRASPERAEQADRTEWADSLQQGELAPLRLQVQLAEQRMARALQHLEAAAGAGHTASDSRLAEWEEAFAGEVRVYATALETLRAAEQHATSTEDFAPGQGRRRGPSTT
jgi:hypothetical protein